MNCCRVNDMPLYYFFEDNSDLCPSIEEYRHCSYICNAKLNLIGIFSICGSENCIKQSKVICVENPNYKEENIFCENKNAECLCIHFLNENEPYSIPYYFYAHQQENCYASLEMNYFHCQPIKSDCNKV